MIAQDLTSLSEEHLSVVLEATRAALWEWNVRAGTVRVTPRWYEMFGQSAAKLCIPVAQWESVVHPDDVLHMRAAMSEYASGQVAVFEAEWRGIHANESEVWVQTWALAVERDADGPVRIIGTNMDITERKRAVQELHERNEQLRQAQKMEAVGRLAGGIAHDFNNLLMVISASAEFLQQSTAWDDPRHDDIDEIRRAAGRAASLTRQLLAFSRKHVLQPVAFSMNSAMQEMQQLLQRVIGKDVELALNLDPAAGWVLADVGQVEQVVMNLVVNARDAMPDGGVVVLGTTRVPRAFADGTPNGWSVRLFVADTGMGMSADVIAHAFDPFFTTKGPGEGTGLGLSTVYGIVQQSGGEVVIHSRPGMGTCVEVTLPEVVGVAEAMESTPRVLVEAVNAVMM